MDTKVIMENKTKSILIKKILESIPYNIKSTNYLMDILELGRESVYRRLKGDIAFTLDEIITLSTNLGFSIDEIIAETKSDKVIFGISSNVNLSDKETYHFNDFSLDILTNLHKVDECNITSILNKVPFLFITDKEYLSRFFYYKWKHQFDKVPLDYCLSDVKIPEEFKATCKKKQHYAKHINTTFILDSNIFYNTFKEIKYYYERGLIENEELQNIKHEISDLLNDLQTIMQQGINEMNSRLFFYISSMHIDNSSSRIDSNNKSLIFMDLYSESCIYTSDPQFCKLHKKKMDSLKKYSILISESNEKMQAEFFSQQKRYLSEL